MMPDFDDMLFFPECFPDMEIVQRFNTSSDVQVTVWYNQALEKCPIHRVILHQRTKIEDLPQACESLNIPYKCLEYVDGRMITIPNGEFLMYLVLIGGFYRIDEYLPHRHAASTVADFYGFLS